MRQQILRLGKNSMIYGVGTMLERLSSYDRAAIAREAKERFCSAKVGAMLYELYTQLVESLSRLRP